MSSPNQQPEYSPNPIVTQLVLVILGAIMGGAAGFFFSSMSVGTEISTLRSGTIQNITELKERVSRLEQLEDTVSSNVEDIRDLEIDYRHLLEVNSIALQTNLLIKQHIDNTLTDPSHPRKSR